MTFRVEQVIVPDPEIWPTDPHQTVIRYVLLDENDWWWLQGHPFGVLRSWKFDRSSSDPRQYLRETEEDAWKDQKQWYDWELVDGQYQKVFL